jgi:hypothetical protein
MIKHKYFQIIIKRYNRNLLWKQKSTDKQLSEQHKLFTEIDKAALYHPQY